MKPVTLDTIKKDLRTAAYVERLMPPVRPPRYRCCMPEIVYTPQEIALDVFQHRLHDMLR